MKAPERSPASRPRRSAAWWLGVALLGSALVHGALMAALVLWPLHDPIEEPGEGGTVALVFADTVAQAGGATPESGDPAEPTEETAPPAPPAPPAPAVPPSEPQLAAPPPPPPAPTPAPPPVPPAPAEAPRDFAALPPAPSAELPAPAQPAEPVPVPEAPEEAPRETLPQPPPPPPQAEPAPEQPAQPPARPSPPRQASQPSQRQAARQSQAPVRLDAGEGGATQEGSLGSFALGAVAPPSVDPGIRNAPPNYPADSRRRGEEGVVRLSLRIGIDGQVTAAEVATTSGYPALDRAALEAAQRWRFRPASRGGLPVAATLTTAVHFRLQEGRGR